MCSAGPQSPPINLHTSSVFIDMNALQTTGGNNSTSKLLPLFLAGGRGGRRRHLFYIFSLRLLNNSFWRNFHRFLLLRLWWGSWANLRFCDRTMAAARHMISHGKTRTQNLNVLWGGRYTESLSEPSYLAPCIMKKLWSTGNVMTGNGSSVVSWWAAWPSAISCLECSRWFPLQGTNKVHVRYTFREFEGHNLRANTTRNLKNPATTFFHAAIQRCPLLSARQCPDSSNPLLFALDLASQSDAFRSELLPISLVLFLCSTMPNAFKSGYFLPTQGTNVKMPACICSCFRFHLHPGDVPKMLVDGQLDPKVKQTKPLGVLAAN